MNELDFYHKGFEKVKLIQQEPKSWVSYTHTNMCMQSKHTCAPWIYMLKAMQKSGWGEEGSLLFNFFPGLLKQDCYRSRGRFFLSALSNLISHFWILKESIFKDAQLL